MAAGTTPIFVATPHYAVVQVTTANTARDGSGTPVTIYSAGANGSLIDFVKVKAVGSTTRGAIRLFIHDGTNARLLFEVEVPGTAPGATEATWEYTWFPPAPSAGLPSGLVLQSGYSLRATTHVSETFNVHAHGGDY